MKLKSSKEDMIRVIKDYNQQIEFDPSESKLKYFHRELLSFDKKGNYHKSHGECSSASLICKTYKAILSIDTQ